MRKANRSRYCESGRVQQKNQRAKTLIQIGFNRRFDPGHGQLVEAVETMRLAT